ncbi:hypothetical protein [Paenarthrobacter ilicis]|uniref:hypothetical protein n=1 Tax=Paenarthrobacter ilicis TaxID=43665 RepID=UPI00195D818A|nr:hypothetical protein [Paenarthrobacter ilicis]MBM7793051.1 hypothetical protein [Paenarthrobacter ilicis]
MGDPTAASAAIAQLLEQLGIQTIIIVDDDFDGADDDSRLAEALANITSLREQLHELGRDHDEYDLLDIDGELLANEELREQLQAIWSRLSKEEKFTLRAELETDGPDRHSISALRSVLHLLPTTVTHKPLTVAEWLETSEELLGDGSSGMLIFFDRNLTNAALGHKGGDDMVRKLYARNLQGVFSGIFTQDATDEAMEIGISEELTNEIGKAVPVLGKWRANSPESFIAGLQVFLHITSLQAVKTHVVTALQSAFDDAKAYLGDVGFYTILASAASAHDEGVLEVDGLLRMTRNHFRKQTERYLRVGSPSEALGRIRKATTKPISSQIPLTPSAASHVIDECFDSQEYLAECNVPTDVGDIYEVSGRGNETTYYILLAQPCDLMVRTSGKRANSPDSFTLARLVPEDSTTGDSERLISIGTMLSGDNRSWAVNLAKRIYLPPQVLDSCVFDAEGRGILRSKNSYNGDYSALPIGWQSMPNKIDSWRSEKVRDVRVLRKLLPPKKDFKDRDKIVCALNERALGSSFTDGTISVDIDENTSVITTGIRRISRLVESRSKALLLQYSHYQARPDTPNVLLRDTPATAKSSNGR